MPDFQKRTSRPAAGAARSGQPDSERRFSLREPVRWHRWLKWGDYLLYILIGGLAAILLLAMPRLAGQPGASAVLTLDGQAILELSAEQLAAGGARNLTANGYHYRFIWEQGRIRFSEADCPDRICVRTGWISMAGDLAACAPGHLILKISGGAGQSSLTTRDVDVILK